MWTKKKIFDKDDKFVEILDVWNNGNTKKIERYVRGILSSTELYNESGILYLLNEYDSKGTLTVIKEMSGSFISKETIVLTGFYKSYTYRQDQSIEAISYFDDTNILIKKEIYFNDILTNVIKYVYENNNIKIETTYDNLNRVLYEVGCIYNSLYELTQKRYMKSGVLIQIDYYQNDVLIKTEIFENSLLLKRLFFFTDPVSGEFKTIENRSYSYTGDYIIESIYDIDDILSQKIFFLKKNKLGEALYFYDTDNILQNIVYYNSSIDVIGEDVYYYTNNDIIIEEKRGDLGLVYTQIFLSTDLIIKSVKTIEYDNNKVKYIKSYEDTLPSTYFFSYTYGNEYPFPNTLELESLYLTKKEIYDSDEVIESEIIFNQNKQEIINQYFFNTDTTLHRIETYENSEISKIVYFSLFNGSRVISSEIYYDDGIKNESIVYSNFI